jgi:hypothetical protein
VDQSIPEIGWAVFEKKFLIQYNLASICLLLQTRSKLDDLRLYIYIYICINSCAYLVGPSSFLDFLAMCLKESCINKFKIFNWIINN